MMTYSPAAAPFAYAIVERYEDPDEIRDMDDEVPDLIYWPIVSRHRTFETALRAYRRNLRKTVRDASGKRVRANPHYGREFAVQAIDPKDFG